jgi:hypothetical protein
MIKVEGLGWRMPGVYVGGRWIGPVSNFPQIAKYAGREGGGVGGGNGSGGGGGGKGGGKEPFLTLGGSNKGQGKNPFITLMGDPNSKAWKNRNPILNFNSPRIQAIRSGRRKPTLAEVAAAAMPLGLVS